MRKTLAALAVVGTAFATPGLASADDCANGEVTAIEANGQTVYFEHGGSMLYLESNGTAGLQRGGGNPTNTYFDTCTATDHDTLLV